MMVNNFFISIPMDQFLIRLICSENTDMQNLFPKHFHNKPPCVH